MSAVLPCEGRRSNRKARRDTRDELYGCVVAPRFEPDRLTNVRRGRSGDAESWTRWAIVPLSELASEEELRVLVGTDDLLDAAIERVGWYGYESGPGRGFAHEPTARRYGRKVLVLQHGGLDV